MQPQICNHLCACRSRAEADASLVSPYRQIMTSPPGRRVSAALAPFVRSLSSYDFTLEADGVHRGLPSTSLSVMLPLDTPVDIGWSGRPASHRSLSSVVSGLHTRPAIIRQRGRQQGILIALTPLGARALLGVPAAAVSGEITDLGTVAPALAHLPERLACLSTGPTQRLELVERTLLAALGANEDADRSWQAAHTLAAVTRTTRVQDAATLLGRSRRQVSGTFRAEFGITPKEYQRIVRFETSRRRLAAMADTGTICLATVAATTGYADQAHLSREWQAMAGCPPTRWLVDEYPVKRTDDVKALT
jgi:AraC-like DNA-binding protein